MPGLVMTESESEPGLVMIEDATVPPPPGCTSQSPLEDAMAPPSDDDDSDATVPIYLEGEAALAWTTAWIALMREFHVGFHSGSGGSGSGSDDSTDVPVVPSDDDDDDDADDEWEPDDEPMMTV